MLQSYYKVIGYKKGSRKRLLDMGFTRGVIFKIIRVAPLGDPIEIEIRSTKVSLRKMEFDLLEVEDVKNCNTCCSGCS